MTQDVVFPVRNIELKSIPTLNACDALPPLPPQSSQSSRCVVLWTPALALEVEGIRCMGWPHVYVYSYILWIW